jgi:hypothetical protein
VISTRKLAWVLAAASVAVLAVEPCQAGRRHRHARGFVPLGRSYSALKLGVYSPEAEGAPDAFSGGIELGLELAPSFDLGLTGDYVHRSRRSGRAVLPVVEAPYDIPVEGTMDGVSSSVHLGQVGAIARLRVPLAPAGPSPFVQAGVLLQVLHLSATERVEGEDAFGAWWEERTFSDTFTGIGWQLGGGVDIPLDRRVGLLAEAGYERAEPTKEADGPEFGTYTAKASGFYLRGGVRIGY